MASRSRVHETVSPLPLLSSCACSWLCCLLCCSLLTVKSDGPCRSTPPRISAALTWPWYLHRGGVWGWGRAGPVRVKEDRWG